MHYKKNLPLPTILCANARSVLMKLDDVRTTLLSQDIDILLVQKLRWLKSTTEALWLFPAMLVFAMTVQIVFAEVLPYGFVNILPSELSFLDSLTLKRLCWTFLLIKSSNLPCSSYLYVPPLSSAHNAQAIIEFVTHTLNDALVNFPYNHVILCYDFNRLKISEIGSKRFLSWI